MAKEFAYVASVKNMPAIFDRIRNAGSPPKFSQQFLQSLGFSSSTDRAIIGVLKALGFLNSDGTPAERYNAYRNGSKSGTMIASGLREGWAEVFLVDQRAYTKSSAELVEIFKSVTGKGEAVAQKMATTFKTLCGMADWSENGAPSTQVLTPDVDQVADSAQQEATPSSSATRASANARMTLHHDVHIHLPATSDLSVYTAIFRALKAELLD
jgi:hypothetical protein